MIVDKDAKDFQLFMIHINEKGKIIETKKTSLHNFMDTFVHHEGKFSLTRWTSLRVSWFKYNLACSSRDYPKSDSA